MFEKEDCSPLKECREMKSRKVVDEGRHLANKQGFFFNSPTGFSKPPHPVPLRTRREEGNELKKREAAIRGVTGETRSPTGKHCGTRVEETEVTACGSLWVSAPSEIDGKTQPVIVDGIPL